MEAFAYLRVSGRGQVDGDGFPRQLAAVQGFAGSHGITVAQVFREKGVSGTVDGIDRPAWVEMIAAAREAGVKVIIAWRDLRCTYCGGKDHDYDSCTKHA